MAPIQLSSVLAIWFFLATVECTPARKGKNQASNVPVTCPGFPGYCSESYPGDTCLVVCARGRNNVPACQADGTWTDVPRCIEHEPGVEEQVPGICPGIPGYCSLDTPGGLCTFECPVGPPVRSSCTPDGTWEPYPTCQGDPRETQDGCNPCPGPLGGPRNRTAEAGGSGGGGRSNNIPTGGNNRKSGGSGGNSRNNNGGNRSSGNSNNGGSRISNNGGNRSSNNGGNRGNGNRNNGNNGGNRQPAPAAQPRSSGGFSSGGGGIGAAANSLSCPGDVLQACIDVCPGFAARVFAACVAGCAKRCPGRR